MCLQSQAQPACVFLSLCIHQIKLKTRVLELAHLDPSQLSLAAAGCRTQAGHHTPACAERGWPSAGSGLPRVNQLPRGPEQAAVGSLPLIIIIIIIGTPVRLAAPLSHSRERSARPGAPAPYQLAL